MDVEAEWDAEIERFQSDVAAADAIMLEGGRRGVALAVKVGEAEAKTGHKYKDGPDATLTKSIKGEYERDTPLGGEGFIEATAEHASWVNDGTDAHEIRPKNKRVLAFEVDGNPVRTKRVTHPGTAADGFMDRAEKVAEEVLTREVEAAAKKAASLLGE